LKPIPIRQAAIQVSTNEEGLALNSDPISITLLINIVQFYLLLLVILNSGSGG
jgi:hypothetical protein